LQTSSAEYNTALYSWSNPDKRVAITPNLDSWGIRSGCNSCGWDVKTKTCMCTMMACMANTPSEGFLCDLLSNAIDLDTFSSVQKGVVKLHTKDAWGQFIALDKQ